MAIQFPPQPPLRSPVFAPGSRQLSHDWHIYFARLNALLQPVSQTWTPSISASGSMTVSSVSITGAYFVCQGNLVVFAAQGSCTLGGTASGSVLFSLPPTTQPEPASSWAIAANAQLQAQGATQFSMGTAWLDSASGLVVRQNGGSNFPLGSLSFTVSGTYLSLT